MSWPLIIQAQHDLPASEQREWIQLNLSAWKETLNTEGALLFRGLNIGGHPGFDRFSSLFGYDDFTYAESLSNAVRINLTPRVFTANEAPPHVEIYLHHEMAQTPSPPQKLFFYCESAAALGGATPICRSDWVARDLMLEHPALFNRFLTLGLKYTTRMPSTDNAESGQGRSWRSTLGVQAPSEAEARLNRLGYRWHWRQDETLEATTPVLPAVKTLSNGDRSFFNQAIAVHLGWQRVSDGRPNLTFGDDSSIPDVDLDVIVDIAKRHTTDLQWQDDDVALIDNHRVMHGRKPYSGERKRRVLVTLALDPNTSLNERSQSLE